MEYLKTKRNLENYTIRSIPDTVITTNSEGESVINESSSHYYYGTIPEFKINKEGNFILNPYGQKIKNTIDINIFLRQDLDDMGIFTNSNFISKKPYLNQKPPDFNSFIYGRLPAADVSFYYSPLITTTGTTDDSTLKVVSSLRVDQNGQPIYVPNLNVSKDVKNTFNGVIYENSDLINYKIGCDVVDISSTGVEFNTYKNKFVRTKNIDGENVSWRKTTFESVNGGWNMTNTSLFANYKKEEYLGVVFPPEISKEVFINRGIADIFERHSILSEIKTTDDIDNFRGGYLSV